MKNMTLKLVPEFTTYNKKVVICELIATIDASSCVYKDIDSLTLLTKGKSTCHSDDNFDLIIGKKIAYRKAKSKMYRKIISHIDFEIDRCTKGIEALSTLKNDILCRIDKTL